MTFIKIGSFNKKSNIPRNEMRKKERFTDIDTGIQTKNISIYGSRAKQLYKQYIEDYGFNPEDVLPKYLNYRNGRIYREQKINVYNDEDNDVFKVGNGEEIINIQIPMFIEFSEEEYDGEMSQGKAWVTIVFDIKAPSNFQNMPQFKKIMGNIIENRNTFFGTVHRISWSNMKVMDGIGDVNLSDIFMNGKKLQLSILEKINKDGKNYYQKDGECVIWFLFNELKEILHFSTYTIKLIKDQFKLLQIDISKGINVNQLFTWVKQFGKERLSIHCLDPRLKVFNKYIPEKKYTRTTLVFVCNNNHLYPITSRKFKKSVAQKGRIDLDSIRWDIQTEFYYRVKKEEYQKVIDGKINNKYQVLIVDDDDIENILICVMNKFKTLMDINIKKGRIVMFVHPETNQIIMISQDYEHREILCKKLFEEFKCESFRFNNQSITTIGTSLMDMIIGKFEKSYYNDETQYIVDKYFPQPQTQRIEEDFENHQLTCIDVKRSYKNAWLKNKNDYPIYTLDDNFKKFDGDLIKCGEYLIEPFLVYGIKFDRAVYNCNLINYLIEKKLLEKSKIKYVLKASYKLKHNTFTKFINYVYDNVDEMGDFKMKKKIINFVIGQLNQKYMIKEKGFITSSIETASSMYHEIKYNEKRECHLDYFNEYYFIREKFKKRVNADNTSINRQIICGGIINLIDMIEKYKGSKSRLIGCKVDSIYIENPINLEDVEKNGHQIENEFHIPMMKEYEFRDEYKDIINNWKWEKKTEDEVKGKSFLCQGIGGSGKSTLLIENNDDETIVFGFTNKCVNSLRNRKEKIDLSTLDKYFKKGRNWKARMSKIKRIQIDEYSMVPMKFWNILYEIKQEFDVIFEIYGDHTQCKSVEKYGRYFNFFKSDFLKNICDFNLVEKKFIEDCGRYDKRLYNELAYLLKNKKLSENWKNKNMKKMFKVNIVSNNNDRDEFINNLHKKIKVGDKVICEYNLYDDEIYRSEFFIIKDIKTKGKSKQYLITNYLKEDKWISSKFFRSSRAVTVYKYQSETIKENFNIHWENYHVCDKVMTLNELYTAVSRGRKFEEVHLKYTDKIFETEEEIQNRKNLISYSTYIKPVPLEEGYIYRCYCDDYTYIGSTIEKLEERLKQHLQSKKSVLYPYKTEKWKIELLSTAFGDREKLRKIEYRYIYFYDGELINKNGKQAIKHIEGICSSVENGAYDDNILNTNFKIICNKNQYQIKIRKKTIKCNKRISYGKRKSIYEAMREISNYKDLLILENFEIEHIPNTEEFSKENDIDLKILDQCQRKVLDNFVKLFENGLSPIMYIENNIHIKKSNDKFILVR